MPKCDYHIATCYVPPTWVRSRQFTGTQHYCDDHAKAESDFGDADWKKLEVPVVTSEMMEADRERLLSEHLD